MPLVQIHVVEGRDREVLKEVARRVTDTVVETLGSSREAVRVQINEMDADFWVIGGVPASERGKATDEQRRGP